MKVPGLDKIIEDLRDIPDATARIENKLDSIEGLLKRLVELEERRG